MLNSATSRMEREFQEKQELEQMAGEGAQQQQVSPFDVHTQAQQLAQQWLSVPYGIRKSQMLEVSKTNPSLHALAKQLMTKMRGSMKTQAYYQSGGQ